MDLYAPLNSKGGAKSIGNSQTEENSETNQESISESNTKSNTVETNFHMSRTVSGNLKFFK
jgi:hypothetical protein